MIAQRSIECILLSVLSVAWVQFPVVAEYLSEFSLTDHKQVQVESLLMTYPGKR